MRPVGVLFDRTFQELRSRWRPLLGIMFLELVGRYTLVITGAAAIAILLLGGADLEALSKLQGRLQDLDVLVSRIVPLIGILLAVIFALALFETWIMTSLFYAAEHPEADLRESLAAGREHMIPFTVVLSLSSLLIMAGLFFFVIPGLILSFLFLLAPNAYFAENRRGWDALQRARTCVQNRFADTAFRLGLGWLTVAATIALAMTTGIPIAGDIVGLAAGPWLALYHSAVFRDLAEQQGAA